MMPIRSRAAAAAVHILTALCAAVGVVLQCGFIGGKLNLAVLQYFTLMSNILCAVYFTGAAVHTLRRGGTWLPVCKGALVMAMAITGITFHLVLAAGDFSMGPTQLITNHLLHTAAPLLTVLDWLLFDEKGRYRWFEPFLWGIFPSAYFVYTMIRARVSSFRFYNGSPYPYAFMDVDALGWGKVLLIFLGMAAAFAGNLLSFFVTPLTQPTLGWLAVALVIFALWRPLRAIWGSILFGGLMIMYMRVTVFPIPTEIYKILPYVVTLIVLVVLSIRQRRENQPPASLGNAYFREER